MSGTSHWELRSGSFGDVEAVSTLYWTSGSHELTSASKDNPIRSAEELESQLVVAFNMPDLDFAPSSKHIGLLGF